MSPFSMTSTENQKHTVTTLLENTAVCYSCTSLCLDHGNCKKKVSQTEQQTYKGESRKAYLRYFSPSVVSQGLFLEKDQTKCFPRSIVSTET